MLLSRDLRFVITCFCLGLLAAVLPGLPAHADDGSGAAGEINAVGAAIDATLSEVSPSVASDFDPASEFDLAETPGNDPLGLAPDQDRRCHAACEERAKAAFADCIAKGGSPDRCAALKKSTFETCVRERCASDAVPCDEACASRARHAYNLCLEGGESEETCLAVAQKVREDCLRRCEPNTAPDCRAKCAAAAERVYQQCLSISDNERACAERKRQTLQKCLEAECTPDVDPGRPRPGPGPIQPDPGACKTRCAEASRAFLRQCVADGGEQAQCERKAKARYDECVKRCDPVISPRPGRCEAGCREKAADELQRCLANGRDPMACRVRIQKMLERCIAECAPTTVRPAPSACEARCEALGKKVYEACIAGSTGAVATDCRRLAAAAVEECKADNCRPKVDECALECRELGAATYRRCISAPDADRAACAAKARETVRTCLEGCRTGSGGRSTP